MLKTFLFLLALVQPCLAVDVPDYIVRTNESGFYQISSSELKQLELLKNKTKLGQLHLQNSNGITPYFFSSGKSKLTDNDTLVFFANQLQGKDTFQHPLDDFNGYNLSRSKKLKTSHWISKDRKNKNLPVCEAINTYAHFEDNRMLIRVNTQQYYEAPELWYWRRLSQLNKKGFGFTVDTTPMDLNRPIQIQSTLRGGNVDRLAKEVTDHKVSFKFNDTFISSIDWDGKIQKVSDKLTIPPELINKGKNTILYIIPKRKIDGKTIIDLALIDYYQIFFSIKPEFINPNHLLSSDKKCKLILSEDQFAYSEIDQSYAFHSVELHPDSKVRLGDRNSLKTPLITQSEPINNDYSQVDYLMITHSLFRKSLLPLADHYEKKGVNVALVNIDQVYQNYSHGIRELSAIKDLIKDMHQQGNGRLKHVLLVGDSSWDWRESEVNNYYSNWASKTSGFSKMKQKKYSLNITNRDFVPTGQFHSAEGHSASDNWFVSIVDDTTHRAMNGRIMEDYIPDLAIGRFPASTVDEIDAMVSKTLNYIENSKVGPWKSKVLWITNSNKRFQNVSNSISKIVGKHGVIANNIFPQEMDGDNLKVQETLTNSMNDGNLIVHFLGHGGKSIWRVGPPDLSKNRDLFTLDNVAQLDNSKSLPFVMSMSCYSAPFDHPNADSIGEKFIRQPDVGAVAVLASSWRNSPRGSFSRYVVDNIYNHPNYSIGQAILEAKRSFRGRVMIEMYNLFGDPALHLAIPALSIATEHSDKSIDLHIDTQVFNGKAVIEYLDQKSLMISKREFSVSDPHFSIALSALEPSCQTARIYVWDSQLNIDAMTSFECKKTTEETEKKPY